MTETSQSVNESNNNDLLTETSQSILSIDTEPIRRTIRLDPTVDTYMNTLCKKNKITKETLFEAAIIVCSNNQKILNKAIADAQKRYSNRKRIGEMKKIVNQKSGVGYRVTIKCLTTILVLEKPTPTRSAFMWEAAAQREAMGVYHINSAAR